MTNAYADIHHYDVGGNHPLDDEGDPLFGFYFQIMETKDTGASPLCELMGPYTGRDECEAAAMNQWAELT